MSGLFELLGDLLGIAFNLLILSVFLATFGGILAGLWSLGEGIIEAIHDPKGSKR